MVLADFQLRLPSSMKHNIYSIINQFVRFKLALLFPFFSGKENMFNFLVTSWVYIFSSLYLPHIYVFISVNVALNIVSIKNIHTFYGFIFGFLFLNISNTCTIVSECFLFYISVIH